MHQSPAANKCDALEILDMVNKDRVAPCEDVYEDMMQLSKPAETAEDERSEWNTMKYLLIVGSQKIPMRMTLSWLGVSHLCILWADTIHCDCGWTAGPWIQVYCSITAASCKGCGKNAQIVWCYLDMMDRNSTGNLQKHAQLCWGDEILQGADTCADQDSAHAGLDKATKQRDGSITAAFERKGKGKLMYSHCQHMKVEARFISVTLVSWNLPMEWSGQRLFTGYQKACNPFWLLVIEVFKLWWRWGDHHVTYLQFLWSHAMWSRFSQRFRGGSQRW